MIRPSCSLRFILLGTLAIGCHDVAQTEVPPTGETFDAGDVFASKTSSLVHHFYLKNSTSQSIRILGESHSCTCTSVTLERATLRPGETLPLVMSVRVPQGYSRSEVSCVATTDYTPSPNWTFKLRFQSYPDSRIVPDRLDLGNLRNPRVSKQHERAWIEVFIPTRAELPTIENVLASSGIEAEIIGPAITEPMSSFVTRARYALNVRSAKGARVQSNGPQLDTVAVTFQEGFRATATVTWDLSGPLESVPSKLHFGILRQGDLPRSKTVDIQSTDGRPFRLLSVEGGSPNLRVDVESSSTGSAQSLPHHFLRVTLLSVPEQAGLALTGKIRVRTDRDDESDLVIPWSAFPRPSAQSVLADSVLTKSSDPNDDSTKSSDPRRRK
jgi:hypothetical protein